ncbi:MAG: formyltransferase family protein [Candidatus Bathyarchaeota archaeon]|nr:formyltransferase family protein [Candidatus Bathyarchaeota archaeon]
MAVYHRDMGPHLIFDPSRGTPMRVACFMSGLGTNARRIIERSIEGASRYRVVVIFTDVRDDRRFKSGEKRCRAKDIAEEYGVAHECVDIRDFYRSRGRRMRRDLSLRPEFDLMVLVKIEPYDIDVIANAGYMSIMTEPLLDTYGGRILNVHPADLSVTEGGERKHVGMHAVRDAILAGERELRATTHVVRERVDYGEILVSSEPVGVELPEGVPLEHLRQDERMLRRVVGEHQRRLKERGDWVIYPLTLQMIAEGRFALDGRGNVYLDGVLAPRGLRL